MEFNYEYLSGLVRRYRTEIVTLHGSIDHVLKSDATMVTELDARIESDIREEFTIQYPDIGFLGEEAGHTGSKQRYMIIDPIDGTSNFVEGKPGVTCIMSYVEDEEPVFSCLYDYLSDNFYSTTGAGILLNGVEFTPEQDRTKSPVILPVREDRAQPYERLFEEYAIQTKPYELGAGHKAIQVLEGRSRMFVATGRGGLWDYVGTRHLMQVSGMRYRRFDGEGTAVKQFCLVDPSVPDAVDTQLEAIVTGVSRD